MMTTCNNCGTKVGKPSTVGFVSTAFPAAVLAGFVCCGLMIRISGWYILAAVPLWLGLTWLLWEGPRWLAWIRNQFRRCPQCGSQDWSRPSYGGFGL